MYQKEQLRIQEVYAEVTRLFKDAPDLLEDFRQFLPDNSQRQDMMQDSNSAPGAAGAMRLPPVGNFAPPGQQRDKRSKRASVDYPVAPPQAQPLAMNVAPGYMGANEVVQSSVRGGPGSGPLPVPQTTSRKRERRELSPTLIPQAPETLPPPTRTGNLQEEIAFFDRVKKFIANKQTYNEFLKIINLFSQRIIDKNVLVERVDGFIGSNRELMDWFKKFVRYEGKPLHVENIAYKKHNLELSLCRSYGPSYRLIPKTETLMPCSGRDEMCWEVLNDEWVVHPTWASEDSGFVAHRKNQYEEILYRVEEERNEYDYYIGSNLRTIQTLETIANRVANMTPEEKASFKLPVGLGHSSTIYQKIIRKIYDKDKGLKVIEALHENPAVAVPIVLRRLKQKDEEWKRAHREWNKVWRETEQKVFYKSLDHIGLTFKQHDKKLLTARSLVAEITTVKAEQTSKRKSSALPLPKSQLSYHIADEEVILDVVSLVSTFVEHGGSYSASDRERMDTFMRSFVEVFFCLPSGSVDERLAQRSQTANGKGTADDASDAGSVGAASGASDSELDLNGSSAAARQASRKRIRESSGDLLKDVLKKSKGSKWSTGRESPSVTPEPDETEATNGTTTSQGESELLNQLGTEEPWLKHIRDNGASQQGGEEETEQGERKVYNLFANTTIYVLCRLIQSLYCRLEEVKSYESIVSRENSESFNVDFARDLGLYDNKLEEMGLRFSPQDCYGQILALSAKLIEGDVEHTWFEEAIRQAYRNRAYKLYTVDKVVQSIAKHIHMVVGDQACSDVIMLFQADRSEPSTDIKKQIAYRMKVKKVIGPDESLFRIDWNTKSHKLGFQFLGNYDLTMKGIKNAEDQWNYYLTSYVMSVPTEGVPVDQIKAPLLYRSMLKPEDENYPFAVVEQGLLARVCMNSYKLFFEAGSVDYFVRPSKDLDSSVSDDQVTLREDAWKEALNSYQTELNSAEKEQLTDRYKALLESGPEEVKDEPVAATVTVEDVEPVTTKSEVTEKVSDERDVDRSADLSGKDEVTDKEPASGIANGANVDDVSAPELEKAREDAAKTSPPDVDMPS